MAVKPYQLPKENYAKLLQAERDLTDAVAELDKAEECGIDCAAARALQSEALERIAKIKQHYAPRG